MVEHRIDKADSTERLAMELERWENTTLKESLDRKPERKGTFITASSAPVNHLYTPADLPDFDYIEELGLPGEYPYTRGVHATMHRGRRNIQITR